MRGHNKSRTCTAREPAASQLSRETNPRQAAALGGGVSGKTGRGSDKAVITGEDGEDVEDVEDIEDVEDVEDGEMRRGRLSREAGGAAT